VDEAIEQSVIFATTESVHVSSPQRAPPLPSRDHGGGTMNAASYKEKKTRMLLLLVCQKESLVSTLIDYVSSFAPTPFNARPLVKQVRKRQKNVASAGSVAGEWMGGRY